MRIERFLIDLVVSVLITCAVYALKYLVWGKVVPNKIEKNRWIIAVGLFLLVLSLSYLFTGTVPEGYSVAVLALMIVVTEGALKNPKQPTITAVTNGPQKPSELQKQAADVSEQPAKKTVGHPFLIIFGILALIAVFVFLVSFFTKPPPQLQTCQDSKATNFGGILPCKYLPPQPFSLLQPCQPSQNNKLQILESQYDTHNLTTNVPSGYLRLYGILKNPSNCIANAIRITVYISDGTQNLQTAGGYSKNSEGLEMMFLQETSCLEDSSKQFCGLSISPNGTGEFDVQFKIYNSLLVRSFSGGPESLRSGLKLTFNVTPVWVQVSK
jgi:hypothetical protein